MATIRADRNGLLAGALRLHQAGQLEQARRAYLEMLATEPDHADALHLLGVLTGQMGDAAEAIMLIERAISKNPRYSAYHNNLGNLLKKHGEQARAKSAYQRAIRLDRKNADAYLNLGKLHQEQGDPISARDAFTCALRLSPQSLEAQMSMGRLEEEACNRSAAMERFERVVRLYPEYAPGHLMVAKCLSAGGRVAEARACLEGAIALDPAYADAWFNLGSVEQAEHRLTEAIAAFQKAIELAPLAAADAYNNLGLTFEESGRAEEAKAAYLRSIALKPEEDAAYFNLGKLAAAGGDEVSAFELFRRAIALKPESAGAHQCLGGLYDRRGELEEATRCYRRATELDSDSVSLRIALGTCLARQGDPEGRWVLEQLLERQPLSAETHHSLYLNLGFIRKNQGYLDEAIEHYRTAAEAPQGASLELRNNLGVALALRGQEEGVAMLEKLVRNNPISALAHFNLGVALLINGRYEKGWAEFEWWRKVDQMKKDARTPSAPRWAGEALHGKTILLYAEQGFGDTLQFLRYLPMVLERGGRVMLEVQPQLQRLLRDLPGVAACVSVGQPLPAHDVALSLMSLPRIFRTTFQTIPPALQLKISSAQARDETYKVGLVWAGNPKHTMDRLRSVPLAHFGALAGVEDVAFTSLQAGPAASQAGMDGQRIAFAADCSQVKDFADTAEIIAGLDLVITVDSAVAHLAGSMGRQVWLLIANIPDWRWGISALRTDWYPTARLFRQMNPGDWGSVMDEVSRELQAEVRRHQGARSPELLRA